MPYFHSVNTLIKNISRILHIELTGRRFNRGSEMTDFPTTEDAWLLIEDGRIVDFGSNLHDLPEAIDTIDAGGGMVLPTWSDSHTHLIYAGTREDEFAMRLKGMSYEEIAAKGGGIINSALKLRHTSEEELYQSAAARLHELILMGTGSIEIKSGYGLSTESELKMLRVARRLGRDFSIPVKTTFLGAHAVPPEFKGNRRAYLELIITEMLPKVVEAGLADYVDMFCEEGYFTVAELEELLVAAKQHNIKSKLHLNQFNILESIPLSVKYDALSVDHLELLGDKDLAALRNSDTIATLLPGCSLFLGIPFAPARKLIDAGAIVALATDYNPGSAPGGNMNLVMSLGSMKMQMTPEESITAATLNGAAAMELSDELGSIEKGKRANLIITKPMNSYSFLPYNFGHNHIAQVLINGKIYE